MSEEKKIIQIREKIDRIDTEIIDLLSERVRLTGEIGALKTHLKKPVVDELRESELSDRIKNLARLNNLEVSFITKLWQIILQESYRVQNVTKK